MLDKILSYIANILTAKEATVTSPNIESIQLAKRAGIISCRLNNIIKLNSGATIIGTLPVGFRPKIEVVELLESPTQDVVLRVTLYPNGAIRVYNYGAEITKDTNALLTLTFVGGGTIKAVFSTSCATLHRWEVA